MTDLEKAVEAVIQVIGDITWEELEAGVQAIKGGISQPNSLYQAIEEILEKYI